MAYYGDEELVLPLKARLQHAWNVFRNKDPSTIDVGGVDVNGGVVSTVRPDRRRGSYYGIDKTIAVAIYNKIATDASSAIIHQTTSGTGGR